jgi:hypothetical protein
LRVADVQTDLLQIVLGIDAHPVAADRPDGSIAKLRPSLTQSARRVRFELVSDRLSGISSRHHDVNVRRSSVYSPHVPASMLAMALTFALDNRALFR